MKLVCQYMAFFLNFSLTSSHLYPLQDENSNSRLVVDEDDNGKFRLERVKATCLESQRSRARIPLRHSSFKETQVSSLLTREDSILWVATVPMGSLTSDRQGTNFESCFCREVCHLEFIHLTILRMFSWTSLT